MRLYRTAVTLKKVVYEGLDGWTTFQVSRAGYRNLDEIPEIIEMDYWEVYGD